MFNPNDTSFFGDDAGFLAGLGIDIAAEEKKSQKSSSTSIETSIEEPVVTAREVTDILPKTKKKPEKNEPTAVTIEVQEPVASIEPSAPVKTLFGNAKVIRREDPKPVISKKEPQRPQKPSRIEFTKSEYKEKSNKPIAQSSVFTAPAQKSHADVDSFITQRSEANKASRSEVVGGNASTRRTVGANGPRTATGGYQNGYSNRNTGNQGGNRRTDGKLVLGGRGRNAPVAKLAPQPKQEKTYKVSDSLKKKTSIILPATITVKEFSEKMGVPLPEVMKVLLSNKIILSAVANIDFDTATLVAVEFEVSIIKEETKVHISDMLEGDLGAILAQDKDADDVVKRAPIVTIMGHVDHGKTKLLDYFRKTDIVKGEAGGITQSIGASQILHNGEPITFIDTPGHELFTSLRARGAKITNIAIIVVAADDGIKQQTVEAINHAKDAGVNIIVAITKSDKGLGKLEEIKGQLAQHELMVESRGGDIMMVPCSAVSGEGINDLLDAILLQTEMMELSYSPSRRAVATILEAHKDAKQGVLSTMLVMTGTLKVGDVLVVGTSYGKVKKMMNRKGETIKTATGGDPVMIMGLSEVPEPGRVVEGVANEKEANKKITEILEHEAYQAKTTGMTSLLDQMSKGDKIQLKLILKADSFGSLEALKYAAQKVELPETIEIKIVHADVGAITDSDLIFGKAANALVVGYNVTIPGNLKKRADQLRVTVKEYDIIYEFIDFITLFSQGLVVVEKKQVIIGNLKVLGCFFRRGKEMIIGGKVLDGGVVRNNAFFRLWRGEEQVATGQITSLQRDKDNVNEVREGYECGMKVRVGKKIELDDRLEFFVYE